MTTHKNLSNKDKKQIQKDIEDNLKQLNFNYILSPSLDERTYEYFTNEIKFLRNELFNANKNYSINKIHIEKLLKQLKFLHFLRMVIPAIDLAEFTENEYQEMLATLIVDNQPNIFLHDKMDKVIKWQTKLTTFYPAIVRNVLDYIKNKYTK